MTSALGWGKMQVLIGCVIMAVTKGEEGSNRGILAYNVWGMGGGLAQK